MKQIFLKACIYYLSTHTVSRGLDNFWAQDISVKNGCFRDLDKNTATLQWHTHVLGISEQEDNQMFWNLESMNL